MAVPPKYYVEALDLITARKDPSPRDVGIVDARLYGRMREILADKNVVGVGICEKITEERNTGELSICYYIEKEVPDSRLRAPGFIPPVFRALNGRPIVTDVQVVGKIRPQVNIQSAPAQSGFSVGHKDSGPGTLGAIVKKGRSLFILSNAHVLAQSGTAALGDAILYPGKPDGGALNKNKIAELSKTVQFTLGDEFVNRCDAAIAKIDPSWMSQLDSVSRLDFAIHGVTGSPGTVAPEIGMKVTKMGRTSNKTVGEIKDIHFRWKCPYPDLGGAEVRFIDQVKCTRFTTDGDSGSIVVEKGTGKIVGLSFAGDFECSVFSRIETVMTDMGGFEFA
jgi:hypothetical protein